MCDLSEHWLSNDKMFFLDSINSRYDYVGSASKTISKRGHGHGGVTIM